jgi:phosphohistidine phosphatase
MKTLYLVRHAKSSWKDVSLDDADRPLNKRGKRDAPFMAKLLREMEIRPDKIISSPAVRTFDTARIFASELTPNLDVVKVPELYLADSSTMIKIIKQTNNNLNSLMLFAHNPGLTVLSNALSDIETDNIPTCGVVKLEFDSDKWSGLEKGSCKFVWFEFPKKYFKKNTD